MYAHGCPFIIKEFNKDYRGVDGQTCCIISMEEVLFRFNMTQKKFTDLCIMFGCDYNKNIKNIGLVKCREAIDMYGCVPNLPQQKYDITILNYPECVEIFNAHKRIFSDICKNSESSLLIDFDGIDSDLEKICTQYSIQNFPDTMRFFYKSYGEDVTLNYSDDPRHNYMFESGIITLNCGNVNIVYNGNISIPKDFVPPKLVNMPSQNHPVSNNSHTNNIRLPSNFQIPTNLQILVKSPSNSSSSNLYTSNPPNSTSNNIRLSTNFKVPSNLQIPISSPFPSSGLVSFPGPFPGPFHASFPGPVSRKPPSPIPDTSITYTMPMFESESHKINVNFHNISFVAP